MSMTTKALARETGRKLGGLENDLTEAYFGYSHRFSIEGTRRQRRTQKTGRGKPCRSRLDFVHDEQGPAGQTEGGIGGLGERTIGADRTYSIRTEAQREKTKSERDFRSP